jgi:hypothetical protein
MEAKKASWTSARYGGPSQLACDEAGFPSQGSA